MRDKIICAVFLLFIFGFSIAGIVMKDRENSEMENRPLEQSPEVSVGKIMDGTFESDLETYLSDQMPMRDWLYSAKVDYEQLMLKTHQNGVYFADDGYLIQDYEESPLIMKNTNYINSWAEKVDSNVPIDFLLVPTATAVLNDKLPSDNLNDDQLETIKTIEKNLTDRVNLINPYDDLKKASEDNQVFYKTDHHWTSFGAYTGFKTLMNALDEDITFDDYVIEHSRDDFYGTLYSKAPSSFQKPDEMQFFCNPDGEYTVEYVREGKTTDTMLDLDKLDTKDKYATFFGDNYSIVKITSNGTRDENVLVLKDSYGNSFVPYLANEYKSVTMIDMRYYHMEEKTVSEYIAANDIDRVIMIYNVDFINSDNNFIWLD